MDYHKRSAVRAVNSVNAGYSGPPLTALAPLLDAVTPPHVILAFNLQQRVADLCRWFYRFATTVPT